MNDLILDEIDRRLLDALQQDASLSNQALAEAVCVSPATCLRRVRRLRAAGLIERIVAIVDPIRLASALGHGLTAIVEINLERQDAQTLERFEQSLVAEEAVQQCWRVSPGPDFVAVIHIPDMPAYHALAQRRFTADAAVRHVRAFFAVHCAKFHPRLPVLADRAK
ncbi:Lrp/AsnC family transcriptional regulator [Tibeticola sp.]|jgi:DNA-binding Lrp family transcriptional regulator|uniref:Lrp/AsnC family transcriptional regulator n=1 Tax=Tibeticola sp. TaxID=2005368 RepID=UPI002584DCC7|nr:Lrp/AsnC family transcriptional regulator [Tibeticola sp.]MCI4440680.1 Lrp/AsnC family transcriptional regulator [Tibeticola sp.]